MAALCPGQKTASGETSSLGAWSAQWVDGKVSWNAMPWNIPCSQEHPPVSTPPTLHPTRLLMASCPRSQPTDPIADPQAPPQGDTWNTAHSLKLSHLSTPLPISFSCFIHVSNTPSVSFAFYNFPQIRLPCKTNPSPPLSPTVSQEISPLSAGDGNIDL